MEIVEESRYRFVLPRHGRMLVPGVVFATRTLLPGPWLGNHFLEVQAVDEIQDQVAAGCFGLALGQVCVMIHCGSRGLGHQMCSDHVQIMGKAMAWPPGVLRWCGKFPGDECPGARVVGPLGWAFAAAWDQK